ncbi:MAG: YdcF family protein [Kiloniellales bacterium]
MAETLMAARPTRRLLFALLAAGLVCAGLWLAGLVYFATNLPQRVADPARRTDAIVVLTGGSGRLRQAFELLEQDRAQQLFVSGVERSVEVAELLRINRIAPPELACCVVLGYKAGDTRGNALETAAWMGEQGFASLRLVTATYHMPRSLLEFRYAMPEIEILPHPVFTKSFKQADWWRWPGSASLLASEYNKYLLAWLRGRLIGRSA